MPRVVPACSIRAFGLPFREALDRAASLGITHLELDAVDDLAPDQISQTGRRQIKHWLESRGLRISVVRALTRLALTDPNQLDRRLNYIQQCLELAFQFGASLVIHKGCELPADDASPASRAAVDHVIERVDQLTSRHGGRLALETTYSSPSQFANYFTNPNHLLGIGVSFLPDLVMAMREPVIAGLSSLQERLLHVRLRDVVRTGTVATGFQQVKLGSGEIDWPHFFATLDELGYTGVCALSPADDQPAEQRGAELAAALDFLKQF